MYIKSTKAEFDTICGVNLDSIPNYIEFNTDAIWAIEKGQDTTFATGGNDGLVIIWNAQF